MVDFEKGKPTGSLKVVLVDPSVWHILGVIGIKDGLRAEDVMSLALASYIEKNGYNPATGEKK